MDCKKWVTHIAESVGLMFTPEPPEKQVWLTRHRQGIRLMFLWKVGQKLLFIKMVKDNMTTQKSKAKRIKPQRAWALVRVLGKKVNTIEYADFFIEVGCGENSEALAVYATKKDAQSKGLYGYQVVPCIISFPKKHGGK